MTMVDVIAHALGLVIGLGVVLFFWSFTAVLIRLEDAEDQRRRRTASGNKRLI